MNLFQGIAAVVACVITVACQPPASDYLAASAISQAGMARNAERVRRLSGREIKLWGFVDSHNLYGDEGAKTLLGAWWSGYGPSAASWRFNLKAEGDDAPGQSFEVRVPNGPRRDALLKAFAADANAGRPTKVFVQGKLFAFAAPANFRTFTGFYLELRSAQDIRFEPIWN